MFEQTAEGWLHLVLCRELDLSPHVLLACHTALKWLASSALQGSAQRFNPGLDPSGMTLQCHPLAKLACTASRMLQVDCHRCQVLSLYEIPGWSVMHNPAAANRTIRYHRGNHNDHRVTMLALGTFQHNRLAHDCRRAFVALYCKTGLLAAEVLDCWP